MRTVNHANRCYVVYDPKNNYVPLAEYDTIDELAAYLELPVKLVRRRLCNYKKVADFKDVPFMEIVLD